MAKKHRIERRPTLTSQPAKMARTELTAPVHNTTNTTTTVAKAALVALPLRNHSTWKCFN